MEELTDVTRAQVAAAMIAVVAEKGEDYASHTPTLMMADGRACIQGAMLAKLGYPFQRGVSYSGGVAMVMRMLGMTERADTESLCVCGCGTTIVGPERFLDQTLADALAVAQAANDSGRTWGLALHLFEGVLAGDISREQGYRELQDSIRPKWGTAVSSMTAAAQSLMTQVAETQQKMDAVLEAAKAAPQPSYYSKTSLSWTMDPAAPWGSGVGVYSGPVSTSLPVPSVKKLLNYSFQ